MHKGAMAEAYTCREFVTPKLIQAGCSAAPRAIGEQHRLANGRIVVTAWKVSASEIAAAGFNLDRKNPNARVGLEHADPKELVASMRAHEAEVMRLLGEIEALVKEAQP